MKFSVEPWLKRRGWRGLAVGLTAFALGLAVAATQIARPWEWKSWDLRLRLLAEPSRASSDIVIFLIDQYSLDVYEKQQGLSWPWPRQLYSAVLDYLRAGGARAVFFDLHFYDNSRSGVADDRDFALAMERSGNVFLPFSLSQTETAFEETPASRLERFAISVPPGVKVSFPSAESASLPVEALLQATRGGGNVVFLPDNDAIFRRLPLAISYRKILVGSAALALARFIKGDVDWGAIPLDKSGQAIIHYYGPSGTYKTYSIASIINSWAQVEAGEKAQVQPAEFAGKIVLVGGSAPGLLELRPTPQSPTSAGVEILAAVLDNILNKDFIRPQSSAAFLILLLVFALFTGIGSIALRKIGHLVLFFLVCIFLPLGAAWLAFRAGYWFELVVPELTVVAGFIGASILNYSVEGRQKRFLKGVFRHYLSPDVIDRIIENPSLLRLGGERREVTSFFSDLAGFTSISEALSPEELVSLLNEYLSEMTDIILSAAGTLDKYEGDAIIAFWNAPLDQPDHALRACRAALACQRRLGELSPAWIKKVGRPLAMRIGLNSGPAVVGNMGSSRRFDYTAMGDTVNLASRLEGACKLYQVPILIGEDTLQRVQSEIVARAIDTVRVVGRQRPVTVYDIIGAKGQVAEPVMQKMRQFERGREAFLKREWERATALFLALKGDGPAELYAERCRSLREMPPPAGWDGVFDLRQK